MDKLFLQILNMSITSSYVILFVIVARLLLKKMPKIFSYGLWALPFIRLVFPFSFESIFSLVSINTRTIPEDIAYKQLPQIQSGIGPIDGAVNRVLPPAVVEASVNPMQIWIFLASLIWITGLVLLLIYSIYTTIKLSKKLKLATHLNKNIYQIDNIKTPFVFGLMSPKIYLPNNLSETEKSYIIKHEETHIKRFDHIIKFLAFLITSIHWFNLLVWIAFYLMGEDMELSCDEAVIKEMGYGIKKDYSNSLLSLSIGKRIVGGSPIAFGENNTKGRIKNILNYKKPKFWISIVGLLVIIVLAVGLLTSPPSEEMTVEDYAWKFIDEQIEIYENGEFGGFEIVDKKITRLEKLASFDNILSSSVELWRLEYRLKPENMEDAMLAGGMQEEDGWITEDSSTGKPNLVFSYEKDKLKYLGNANSLDFDMNTLASQEIGIRIMLENQGLLANVTYPGNHAVIQFPLSTGETSQLLLSQPIVQGDRGIWAVERWMDGNGTIYYEIPRPEKDMDIKIEEYYKKLQEQSTDGENSWLLDPVEVGYDYIINSLGQTQVKIKDLVVTDPASLEDFLRTPESNYVGYITMMTEDESLFHFDKVEFITLEDEERVAELGLDIDYDMPSGFYIYDPESYPAAFDVLDDTEYLLLDLNDSFKYKSVTKKEFIEYNEGLGNRGFFRINTRDGYVIRIEERYLP